MEKIRRIGAMGVRVLPFAAFMAFIGLQELLLFLRDHGLVNFSDAGLLLLYPVKISVTLLLLLLFWGRYNELNWRDLTRPGQVLFSLGLGLLVFGLWINMDWRLPFTGNAEGYNPDLLADQLLRRSLIGLRFFGAVVVVPIMEELFWRSFLLRYLIDPNFEKVAIGGFSWLSCLATIVLFGLEHHLFYAGLMAGLFYNLLLYRSRSLAQCIFAHAVTNFALGLYVIAGGRWLFW